MGSYAALTEMDKCQTGSHSCPSNGQCFKTIGSYVCTCKPGYYGEVTKSCTGKV